MTGRHPDLDVFDAAVAEHEAQADLNLPAGLRLTETDLDAADAVIDTCAEVIDLAFGTIGINHLGDVYRQAWADVRPLLEQRLCDCPRDPYHRWNCPATPLWAQTIRDLDTNPWIVFRPHEMAALGEFVRCPR